MKEPSRYWRNAVGMAIAMALVWGCGAAPLVVKPIDPAQNPKELSESLGQQLEQARGNQVGVLSPTWFKRAEASYAAARQQIQNNAPVDETLKTLAVAQAELQQAQVVTIRSRDQLAEAIESRNAAQSVNAQQFGREYDEVERDFYSLTRAMEDSEFDYARRHRQKVSERYRALELRAIELAAVGDVRELIRQAMENKVHQVTPKTFVQAQEALSAAEAHIGQDRYDQAGIKEKSDMARFLTQRSMVIAETSRVVAKMPPEDIALWMETFLFQTTTRLHTQDQRNVPFHEQQNAILAAVDQLRTDLTLARKSLDDKTVLIQKMGDRLAEVEGSAQQVRQEQQRLMAAKRLDDLFLKAQASFEPHEASVTRKSDQIIIRLKGLHFPAGGDKVMPADYPLLSKVHQVIVDFGAPDVIIEGYTDSTGIAEKNRALSRKRAEAVKQFLENSLSLPIGKISAVGHGDARPVASNDTTAGRAQNRRIEVIIKSQRNGSPDA